ncbi:N-acetyltransferase [Pseudonocardiaceae bacterium YIM PH 21723]|nr:N-acetyltransferase [Pseudonocardiaceae bacterium YIM PH 21723]
MGDLRLRPVRESDLDWLDRYTFDEDFLGQDTWSGFTGTQNQRRRFAETGFLTASDGRLVIDLADTGPIGIVLWYRKFYGPNEAAFCWGIGISLWPEHRGRGHGSAAQRLLADYLFAHSTVRRIEADTLPENIAEQRALEKAGFQRDGVFRGAWFLRGRWRDCVVYSLLRGES